MKYLKWILILFLNLYAGLYFCYAQKLLMGHIVSTQIVALKYQDQVDTLRIPVVSDKYPALKKALSYKNIFDGDDLQDVIKKYSSCGCGITSFNYNVCYDSKGVLSIILYYQTMGAYPDNSEKWLNFNIETGEPYLIAKEINDRGVQWVFNNYKAAIRKRIDADKLTNDDENDDIYNSLKTELDSLGTDELFGKYVFIQKGIMFSTDNILPHVTADMEPNRDWIVPYKELKNYKAATAIVLTEK